LVLKITVSIPEKEIPGVKNGSLLIKFMRRQPVLIFAEKTIFVETILT